MQADRDQRVTTEGSSRTAGFQPASHGRTRFEGLNSLRGLAASLVVIVHVWAINPLPETAGTNFMKIFFPLGVALFFVISAFSLCVSTTDRVGQSGWLSAFAIRRVMRIAPLFYLAALFYLLVVPMIVGGPRPWGDFFLTLSFLFNLVPGEHVSLVWAGWTIGVEMLFYVILPFILVFVGRLRSATVLLLGATAISCMFIEAYRAPIYPQYYADLSFMGSIGIFAWGIFGHALYQTLREHRHVAAISSGILALSVLGAGFLVATDGRFFHLPVTRSLLWAPVFGGLVLSQCLRPNLVFTNRVLSHLGTLSFSLYLCHPPLVHFLHPVFLGIYDLVALPEAALLACVLLTFALLYPVSRLTFALVEQPGIRAGEWLIRRRLARDDRAFEAPRGRAQPAEWRPSGAVAPLAGPELLVVEPAKRSASGQ
jgi:peptidoglycan/LPS O-acetylase OafA/YrhL